MHVSPLVSSSNPAAALTVAPPPARAGDEVVLQRGDAIPVPGPGTRDMNDPNKRFVRVHWNDVLALRGFQSLSYSAFTPDQLKLRFYDLQSAQIADAALKDVVLGAKLVYADPKGNPYDMGAGYTGRPYDIGRLVAAMPGVTGVRGFGRSNLLLTSDSAETRVRLQQLVNRKFGDAVAYWKGECFGRGCKPDPKPPSGEWPPQQRRSSTHRSGLPAG